ncbi:glutathione reductase [Fructilactobacillus lindneri]|uniref:Pyruvate 2-oxoglutarate dehydrogenase complex, dihydrolipoamide dehydrogenase (E3) component n=2 Tax=Fructilactobacillus lindneri TaxID=53444 RepID=A0A0R2JTZ5_9LACO|nr:NAD(P)/FAD-dependent oxidoreductase [Fructilactobacillus lindneri]ANZ57518.1 glutathione reductase [Fructilactobacillus lindneri]ANZ58786.1 glutathione reductase [Fructilactobacillus lindneri]KRN80507.1 pyruvate 2-oxoglutarate dehydrogenase complex, dihydrolipoamide dehydrogenase (E3) component [Fructilactobacillus lindneri DSM 20690 = JCM 11027]POG97786.1 glutathione reductase [Fructilactobacillus lindneri]POG99118.1 glutathione reductase [Fructilactobacillus lindneri]
MTENNYQFDVLYLGSGHGAFNGAIPLAMKGKKLGVIEAGKVGGTCPNRGCNAKISLDMPVKVKQEVDAMQGRGLDGTTTINWKQNVQHEKEVINSLPGAIEESMTSVGIDVIHGYGKLVDGHTIDVDGNQYTANKIVIATGAHYNQLDIPGIELAHNGTAFLNLEDQPQKMTIIGGGYIAIEFATIAAYAGTEVTLLLHHDKALRKFYQPFVEELLTDLEKHGVKIIKNVTPESIEHVNDAYVVKTNQGDVTSNWVLDATGRNPNVENIGLNTVGVEYDKNGIKVNDHLQTSVDSIYATGDVVDKSVGKLTPTAIFESSYLTKLFSGATTEPIDYPAVPSAVFTSPRIAQVGVSVDEAKANPDKYDVKEANLASDWFRFAMRENKGKTITIFDKKGYLVGMTEISSEADNSIASALPFIEYQISPEKMNDFITLFPTVASETKHHL